MNIRPYIIINGINSKDVKGLLVCSVPTITKPKIRIQTEEIDGRDGDIVTKLGYGAYDKAIEIGLTKDYDVDEIAGYFNSAGEVVFSNEPDKAYRYAIYDGINFDRLLRFKTASVNFHVQPFKYSYTDRKKIFDAPTSPLMIANYGNVESAPVYFITASGNVALSLNGVNVMNIAFGGSVAQLKIDTENLEAVAVASGALANRSVAGDYNDLRLKKGKNILSWTGNIQKLEIDNFVRWV